MTQPSRSPTTNKLAGTFPRKYLLSLLSVLLPIQEPSSSVADISDPGCWSWGIRMAEKPMERPALSPGRLATNPARNWGGKVGIIASSPVSTHHPGWRSLLETSLLHSQSLLVRDTKFSSPASRELPSVMIVRKPESSSVQAWLGHCSVLSVPTVAQPHHIYRLQQSRLVRAFLYLGTKSRLLQKYICFHFYFTICWK